MRVRRLKDICICGVLELLNTDESAARRLPSKLFLEIATVKNQIDIFKRAYGCWLRNPTIQLPVVLTEDAQLDFSAVTMCCIQRYLQLANGNSEASDTFNEKSFLEVSAKGNQIPEGGICSAAILNAFFLAAIGAFEDKCAQIWAKLSTANQHYLINDESIPETVRAVAWRLNNYSGAYQHYWYICVETAVNGWYSALQLWLQRIATDAALSNNSYGEVFNANRIVIDKEQLRILYATIIVKIFLYRNYFLLPLLLEKFDIGDFKENFHLFFPDGHIAEMIKALADAPHQWQYLAIRIGVALIDWGPWLNIIQAKRDVNNGYSSRSENNYPNNYCDVNTRFEHTAKGSSNSNCSNSSGSINSYIEYIDLLLECSHRYSSEKRQRQH